MEITLRYQRFSLGLLQRKLPNELNIPRQQIYSRTHVFSRKLLSKSVFIWGCFRIVCPEQKVACFVCAKGAGNLRTTLSNTVNPVDYIVRQLNRKKSVFICPLKVGKPQQFFNGISDKENRSK